LYDTPIDIVVENLFVGNVTKVTVTVPVNATGDITIVIDGITLTNSTTDGVAVFHVEGLTAGNKTVTAKYFADAIYAFNSTTKDFTISKLQSSVKVTTFDISVSDDAIINIVGPSDFNGIVTVTISGVGYYANMIDGKCQLIVGMWVDGTYDIVVTLEENDKYLSSFNDSAKLNVSKVKSELTVSFDNITVGENVVFNVTVSDFGNLTITIGDKTTVVGVKAGANTIVIPDIGVGVHDVAVVY
jgi:hypothetical protein